MSWAYANPERMTDKQQQQQQVTGALGATSHQVDLDNFKTSPFFLATGSVAVIGWLIAFFASIAANVDSSSYPHFAWWTVMYQLFVLAGVLAAVAVDAIDQYRLCLCAFLAAALSFTSSTANVLVYSDRPSEQAAAAGHIFLSMVNICWIFYFGSAPDTLAHRYLDTPRQRAQHAHVMQRYNELYPAGRYGSPYPKSNIDSVAAQIQFQQQQQQQQQQLGRSVLGDIPGQSAVGGEDVGGQGLEFKHRARAIYTYDANPEDPNEISFTKGEVLEVADISGKWFQARNAKGEVGIAPSNYLKLLADGEQ
ncbi:Transmembrane osmosensor [Savitreella phatthalungensis]